MIEKVKEVATDGVEVCYDAIVHDSVAAECKGVVVDRGDRCGCGCADVGEQSGRGGVGADGVEIEVVGGRLTVLVDSWARSLLEFRQHLIRHPSG